MKKFKKISAILGGLLMVGFTAGIAAAASYPAPFVDSGVADVAIVYGTGAGVSTFDMVQAQNIQTSLGGYVSGETTVTGGEAFELDKDSNHFNYGDALNSVYTTLSDSHMEFLDDVTYDDGDIDEDYSQKIVLGTDTLKLFQDIDVNDDKPTLGFKITDGNKVLDYVIDFDSGILYSEMDTTYLPLFGNEYYILNADKDTIELLDTAEKTIISEGETITIGGKTISIEYVDSTDVKLNVGGELTDKLSENEEYELNDGSYLVVTENLYSEKETGISKVEFAIGNGKITLHDGGSAEAELNDEDIDGLFSDFTDGTSNLYLGKLTLTWKTDEDTFLTKGNSITMPAFETISVIYNGLDFPSDSEIISLDNGEKLTLTMGNYDLKVMYHGVSDDDIRLGEKDHELILLAKESLTFDEAGYVAANATYLSDDSTNFLYTMSLIDGTTAVSNQTTNTTAGAIAGEYLANVLPIDNDQRFIVTRIKDDITDLETLYYEIDKLDADDSTTVLKLEDMIGDNDIEFSALGNEEDRGDVTVTLEAFNAAENTAYLTFTASTDNITYNKAVSETGLVVTLPSKSGVEAMTSAGANPVDFLFTEANDEDDLNSGIQFKAVVKANTDGNLFVGSHNVTDFEESNDYEIGYVNSALVSKTMFDTSGDENDFSIEYFGKEVTADVIISTGGAVISTGDALGEVLLMDTEIATATANNLIIVGGSCINSAAATVLGGAYCGAAFTGATGVNVDQFLIKGFDNAFGDKFAVVVAGYEMADTVSAATYLTMQKPDLDKTWIGTSATEATEKVEAI